MNPTKYGRRIEQLKTRRQDRDILQKAYVADALFSRLTERYETAQYPESVRYALGCMEEVDDAYTKNTFAAGNRVAKHLEALPQYNLPVEFAYQGSVTNNTHIKVYSDIDLLVVIGRFYGLEPPLVPPVPYRGDPLDDLLELRTRCLEILTAAFPAVDIDDSGSKSIALSGGSLRRKVDVVPSDWYDTARYYQTRDVTYRGIEVFDKDNRKRVPNLPFLHNRMIDQKDIEAISCFRPAVRLVKNLKADSDRTIDVSSYGIASVLYHMDSEQLRVGSSKLLLVPRVRDYLVWIYQNDMHRSTLSVPNGMTRLSEAITKTAIGELAELVHELATDLETDLRAVRKALSEQVIY